METEDKLRLAEVFVSITDPRQPGKVEHDLVELLVVAVSAVLVGADTFVARVRQFELEKRHFREVFHVAMRVSSRFFKKSCSGTLVI